jgi:hypothetical protein
MESRRMSAAPRCPFCEGADSELVGRWGGQMITAQWRCGACGSYFEAIRDSFDERADDKPAQTGPAQTEPAQAGVAEVGPRAASMPEK